MTHIIFYLHFNLLMFFYLSLTTGLPSQNDHKLFAHILNDPNLVLPIF